jgi:large subunit ribosomal protein L22
MEAKAIAKYMRISPRKMKFVCDMVRGKHVDEALAILKFHPGKGAKILEKVVKSAVANAENNFDMDRDKLYISSVYANQGPTLKRLRQYLHLLYRLPSVPFRKGIRAPLLHLPKHIWQRENRCNP